MVKIEPKDNRRIRVVKELVENGGALGPAIRKAGYSEAVAKTPKKLTDGDRFQELLEEYIPESKLLKVQNEGLAAEKHERVGKDSYRKVADHQTRHLFLRTGLQLRGRLKESEISVGPVIVPVLIQKQDGRTEAHNDQPASETV